MFQLELFRRALVAVSGQAIVRGGDRSPHLIHFVGHWERCSIANLQLIVGRHSFPVTCLPDDAIDAEWLRQVHLDPSRAISRRSPENIALETAIDHSIWQLGTTSHSVAGRLCAGSGFFQRYIGRFRASGPDFQFIQLGSSSVEGGVNPQSHGSCHSWLKSLFGGFRRYRTSQGVLQTKRFELLLQLSDAGRQRWQLLLPAVVLGTPPLSFSITHSCEYGLQIVVVLLRDRVELVIVAPRAADREAKKNGTCGFHDFIQLVLTLLRFEFGVLIHRAVIRSGYQEAGCGVFLDLVASELLENELVVRLVRIQGPDDIVSIGPRVGKPEIHLVARRFSKPHKVQPMLRPALTVTWAGQGPLNHTFVGQGVRVGKEV